MVNALARAIYNIANRKKNESTHELLNSNNGQNQVIGHFNKQPEPFQVYRREQGRYSG
jgi:hypothetical protein